MNLKRRQKSKHTLQRKPQIIQAHICWIVIPFSQLQFLKPDTLWSLSGQALVVPSDTWNSAAHAQSRCSKNICWNNLGVTGSVQEYLVSQEKRNRFRKQNDEPGKQEYNLHKIGREDRYPLSQEERNEKKPCKDRIKKISTHVRGMWKVCKAHCCQNWRAAGFLPPIPTHYFQRWPLVTRQTPSGQRSQSVMAGKERKETEMESALKDQSLEPRNCWDANKFLLELHNDKFAIRRISESETKKRQLLFPLKS